MKITNFFFRTLIFFFLLCLNFLFPQVQTTVDKKQIVKRNPLNMVKSLQGVVARVMVSSGNGAFDRGSRVCIHGVATINSA